MAILKYIALAAIGLVILYKYPKLLTLVLIVFGSIVLIRLGADLYYYMKDKGQI